MATYDRADARSFLDYVDDWYDRLPAGSLGEAIAAAGGPDKVGIFAIDVLKGFCVSGPLAGERVGSIVAPIVELLRAAYDSGVRRFILPQDAHPPDSPEFEQYGPHCLEGTEEAETVDELMALPFSHSFEVVPKRSIGVAQGTRLDDLLESLPPLGLAICVGDCTDLCLYQLVMHLKLRSNADDLGMRVLVPANCVDTYDLSVEQAQAIGATPHDAELLHRLFLYHMALNGVDVVREIA
ncbi:MAG: cysteine hydrolase family protein [Armatimonadota bacterium]